MTDLTDRLVRDRLGTPEARAVYHYDATFHAEWTLFSQALDRAHAALLSAGNEDADRIVEVLSLGFPDTEAARRRVREAQAEAVRRGRGDNG